MEMWKANNASHIPTAPTTTAARYARPQPEARNSSYEWLIKTGQVTCYRSVPFAYAMRQQNIRHRFTRPYTPRTNGKAERFIQTAIREWAYARTYQNSEERQQQLQLWLHDYNFHRPHASLNHNTPASRSGLNRNNLLTLHT